MTKKNRKIIGSGIVFSTNPDYVFAEEETIIETLPPAQQKLKIWLETKHRGGKTVSVVEGFLGIEEDLTNLAKALKTLCGTGGSVKDGAILIQGDHRDKIMQYLVKNGYKNVKKAGG